MRYLSITPNRNRKIDSYTEFLFFLPLILLAAYLEFQV
jgi:hypothetical protein